MRRVLCFIVCGTLAIGVTIAQETGQKTEGRGLSITNDNTTMFTTNQCFSKGGLGIVNKSLYIVVRSARDDRNELIVKPTDETERRWTGQSVAKAEIVVLYGGKICSIENLPDRFDLSKATIVSFESDKVRFFDFQKMFGGYYDRIKTSSGQ